MILGITQATLGITDHTIALGTIGVGRGAGVGIPVGMIIGMVVHGDITEAITIVMEELVEVDTHHLQEDITTEELVREDTKVAHHLQEDTLQAVEPRHLEDMIAAVPLQEDTIVDVHRHHQEDTTVIVRHQPEDIIREEHLQESQA
jgi:hypothetical protein